MKRIVVALVLFVLTGPPAFADAVRVLPAAVPSGADVNISGRGLAVGARYLISLEQGGTVENLGFVPVDGAGRFDETIGLPPLTPGEWQVQVSLTGTVVATAPLRILPNPGIETNPGQGYPGETIEVQGFGLTPGADVEIRVDGLRLVGPVAVETPEDVFSFDVPASTSGVDESINVVLRQSFGGLDAGQAPSAITRLAPQQTTFGSLVMTGVPNNLGFSQTYSLTGSIQVPDGLDPADLQWQYAVAVDGLCLPVPSAVVSMESGGDFAVLDARVDGLIDGVPARYLNQTFDEHGLVYRNPETGEQDCVTIGGLNLREEEFVPLRVKVVDDLGNPIGGARVVLRRGFYLSPFEDPGDGRAPGGSGGINTTDAHLYGPNQYTEAEFEFQQEVQDLINGRCPATGELQYTVPFGNDAGVAAFELNPLAYWAQYQGGHAASNVALGTTAPIPDPLQFSIKVAALDLGYGYETVEGCGTGVRFDLQVRNDGFYLRDPNTNEFTIFVDPFGDPVEIALPDLPQNTDLCFPADPYMAGLSQEIIPGGGVPIGNSFAYTDGFTRIRRVISFPQPEVPDDWFTSITPAAVELEYDQALFGQLENIVLTLGDEPPIPMSFSANGGSCDIDGGIITGEIPDMHRYPAGIYAGTISGEIGTSGRTISQDLQIVVEEGVPWFVDATQYENIDIFWNQDRVTIWADEVTQMQDATLKNPDLLADLATYDVSLDGNDQAATATVEQKIIAGQFQNRVRTSITDGQVNGRSEPQGATVSNLSEEDDGTGTARSLQRASATGRGETCAHPNGEDGAPGTPFPRPNALTEFGSCEPETLFETGNIPIFRYAWGVPPIAAATLGADIWFGVYFRYFGDVALELQKISVNFTAEPIVRAGLDIFFDLSALFGVVTARVEATPTIGIGMPISVIDSEFDGIEACFNFDLLVAYIASIGWCDLCLEAKGEETLFTVAEPEDCSVFIPKANRGVAPIVANARPAVAINEQGTTWVAYESEQGIQVEQRQGPLLIRVYSLASQPGAMRPEMVWMDGDTAIVVWNQTDLTEQQFLAIDGQANFSAASSQLHLVYAVYDANTDSFGPTQDLTMPGMGGDGGIELAVCPSGLTACGGGRILAAWEHDRAGDLGMHDLEVRWAEFDGVTQTWGPVSAIDPGNAFKQVQPEVLYHDGEPMVLWIENPDADGTAYDMNQRHLRYRFPNLAPAQDAPGVPSSIASPDAVSQNGEVLVAYTVSADPTRFIGARRSLHTATGVCAGGTCSWLDEERIDARGRSLYIEQPQVVRGGDGRVTAYFRYLANSDVQEDDPVGVRTGTGDIAKLELLAPSLTEPTPLTNDGRVNWGIQAVVNPVNGDVFTALTKGPQLSVDVLRSVGSKAVPRMRNVRGVSGNAEVFLGMDPSAPDFAIVDASTTADRVAAGQSVEVGLRVMNRGGPAAGGNTLVVATWDHPFGAALPAASQTVDLSAAGSLSDLVLQVPAPENADVDQQRVLYITVDPGAAQGDADAADSVQRLVIGGLPVPENLRTATARDSQLVQIDWTPIDDERVTGYTVYRRNPDGRVLLLGTTETNGFLDLRAVPDTIYQYQVRSHSAKLSESEPSPWMEHYLQALIPRGLLFRDGFEVP